LKKRIIIIVFIILFVTVGLLVYFGQKNNREKGLFYSGTIETTQANLSFQVPGRVVKVNVQEGQSVTKIRLLLNWTARNLNHVMHRPKQIWIERKKQNNNWEQCWISTGKHCPRK